MLDGTVGLCGWLVGDVECILNICVRNVGNNTILVFVVVVLLQFDSCFLHLQGGIVNSLKIAIAVQMLLRCFAVFLDNEYCLRLFADKRIRARRVMRDYWRHGFFTVRCAGSVNTANL